MALELKLDANYVIYTETTTGVSIGEYPINHSSYRETDTEFIIKERIDNGVLKISKADVDAGKWVDDLGTAFTQATIRTFLRENTGFKTASGGSGAEFYTEVLWGEAEITSANGRVLIDTISNFLYLDVQEIEIHYYGGGGFFDIAPTDDVWLIGNKLCVDTSWYNSRNRRVFKARPNNAFLGNNATYGYVNGIMESVDTGSVNLSVGIASRINPESNGSTTNAKMKFKIWYNLIPFDIS